ncbi:hypothetical protein VNI00_005531 [Paramarasmius palmivorus]|uniref:Uncharacterized protein n=1 Tax=Paramarasmius palmivorus TaxID=297713 RepID=A0AAW0DE36_9AGAR
MNHNDAFPDSPPPPAYSEQEFDQKLSTALQQSLTISDDQEWEEWDEAKFEAAVAARSRSGESKKSYPPEKKGASYTPAQSFSNTATAGPSRYVANGGVEEQTSSGSASSSHSRQSYAETPASSSAHQVPSTPYEDAAEQGSSTPPPTFTSVGPSLDGPPYEEVVLSYTGTYDEDDGSSSVHLSDQSLSQPQRLEYIPPPRPSSAATTVVSEASFAEERRSLPAPPRVVDERGHFGVPRSASYGPSRPTYPAAPRMSFNPSVAYKRELGSNNDLGNTFQNTAPAVAFDATAFYKEPQYKRLFETTHFFTIIEPIVASGFLAGRQQRCSAELLDARYRFTETNLSQLSWDAYISQCDPFSATSIIPFLSK